MCSVRFTDVTMKILMLSTHYFFLHGQLHLKKCTSAVKQKETNFIQTFFGRGCCFYPASISLEKTLTLCKLEGKIAFSQSHVYAMFDNVSFMVQQRKSYLLLPSPLLSCSQIFGNKENKQTE